MEYFCKQCGKNVKVGETAKCVGGFGGCLTYECDGGHRVCFVVYIGEDGALEIDGAEVGDDDL